MERRQFGAVWTAALRYADLQSLRRLAIVGLSVAPSSVASILPSSVATLRRILSDPDPRSIAWLAVACGNSDFVTHLVREDLSRRGSPLSMSVAPEAAAAHYAVLSLAEGLEALAEAGDAEACLRLAYLHVPLSTFSRCKPGNVTGCRRVSPLQCARKLGLSTRQPSPSSLPAPLANLSKRAAARWDARQARAWLKKGAALGSGEAATRLSICLWGDQPRGKSGSGGGSGGGWGRGKGGGGLGDGSRAAGEHSRAAALRQLLRGAAAGDAGGLLLVADAVVRGDLEEEEEVAATTTTTTATATSTRRLVLASGRYGHVRDDGFAVGRANLPGYVTGFGEGGCLEEAAERIGDAEALIKWGDRLAARGAGHCGRPALLSSKCTGASVGVGGGGGGGGDEHGDGWGSARHCYLAALASIGAHRLCGADSGTGTSTTFSSSSSSSSSSRNRRRGNFIEDCQCTDPATCTCFQDSPLPHSRTGVMAAQRLSELYTAFKGRRSSEPVSPRASSTGELSSGSNTWQHLARWRTDSSYRRRLALLWGARSSFSSSVGSSSSSSSSSSGGGTQTRHSTAGTQTPVNDSSKQRRPMQRRCAEAHACTSGSELPSSELPSSELASSELASSITATAVAATPIARAADTITVATIEALHRRNCKAPHKQHSSSSTSSSSSDVPFAQCVIRSGGYLNLLRSNLHPAHIAPAFAALRHVRRESCSSSGSSSGSGSSGSSSGSGSSGSGSSCSGSSCSGSTRDAGNRGPKRHCIVSRLGLSHNRRLGPDGGTAVARQLRLLPSPTNGGGCAESAVDLDAVRCDGSSPPLETAGRLSSPPTQAVATGPVADWLTELFFSDCGLGTVGAKRLAPALACCGALTKLGLNYNGIGDAGAAAIFAAVRGESAEEAEESAGGKMDRKNRGDGGNQQRRKGQQRGRHCRKGKSGMASLRVLGLIGNGISDTGACAAAALLRPCDISSKHSFFWSDIEARSGLTRLYLNENTIGDEGSIALAQAVVLQNQQMEVPQTQLKELHEGAEAERLLSPSRRSLSSPHVPMLLERLGLSENSIGAAGGSALAAALSIPGGTAIEKLCASDNPFGYVVHSRLAALPNAFVGEKPRKHREHCVLDGRFCRVMVVWQPLSALRKLVL